MSILPESRPTASPPTGGYLRPSFIVIGAQKGGTTALYTHLGHHPLIRLPQVKELNFFMGATRPGQGYDDYHSRFPRLSEVRPGQVTFEASPNYLVVAEVAVRIQAYDPSMKLIALLRDPIDRAHSAWHMYRRFFRKKPNWYFEWMQQMDAAIDSRRYVRRGSRFGEDFAADIRVELEARSHGQPIEAPLLRHGCYAEQLSAFMRVFPPSQLYVEYSERFFRDPHQVLSEIAQFVGLPPLAWDAVGQQPVFAGDYSQVINDNARELLRAFYAPRNESLFRLLGRSGPWQ